MENKNSDPHNSLENFIAEVGIFFEDNPFVDEASAEEIAYEIE